MPKIEAVETPEKIRPYVAHGVDINWRSGEEQATADCPFCGKESKFRVSTKTGLWDCKVCQTGTDKGGGNVYTFLREVHRISVEQAEGSASEAREYEKLAAERGLLTVEPLRAWGVVRSAISGEWLVPGYSVDGKISQLYRYIETLGKDGRRRKTLLPTTGVGLHLMGVGTYAKEKESLYICEGPWDGMALWESLRFAKRAEGGLVRASEASSLYSTSNVVSVPGALNFFETWTKLGSGKLVRLMYDNDHPREVNGRKIAPVGMHGMKRASGFFGAATEPPSELRYLRWGDEGYTFDLKSGYDVRDSLREGKTIAERITKLDSLLSKVHAIPEEWLTSMGRSATPGRVGEMDCVDCASWKELTLAWRKAMTWTQGLDDVFSVMLASVTSTRAVGDQLWIKLISPPSCLDGDTPIYDPVEGSTIAVAERYARGEPFHVWTRKESRLRIGEALPPVKFNAVPMYEVTFASGRRLRVTGGHRFWDGTSYVALHAISDALVASASYPVPSISGSALLARQLDALHSLQIAEDSEVNCCACSYLDGEQPPLVLGTGLDASPSRGDVQERSRSRFDAGDLGKECRRTHLRFCLQSNSGVPLLVGQQTGESGYLPGGDTCEPSLSQLPYIVPFLQSLDPTRIEQSSAQSLQGSTERIVSQCLPREESSIPLTTSLGDVFVSLPSSLPPSTDRRLPGDVLPSWDASQRGDVSRPLVEDTSGPLAAQQTSIDNTRQLCAQLHRGQHTLDDVQQTKQQPLRDSFDWGKLDLGVAILSEVDRIVKIEYIGEREYYDFHVPGTENYWAEGLFHHNTGKTTLCEALAIAKTFIYSVDTMTGLVSGYQIDKEGSENQSLAIKVRDKTLVIKDGDTILSDPSLPKILSQFRAFYDRSIRTSYGNKMSADHEGCNTTVILCGTNSLRKLDTSELGERFLTVSVMDSIDEDLETQILWRVANRAERSMSQEADGKLETRYEPALVEAMQLTGGYVHYLRENARVLLEGVLASEERLRECMSLGRFVSYMRARPSDKQDETAEREFAARLVSQHVRLAKCLAVVLNKSEIDDEVMRRVRKVAFDTAKGRVLTLVEHIFREQELGRQGADTKALALWTGHGEDKERTLLKFMKRVGALDLVEVKVAGLAARKKWRLSARMEALYREVTAKKEG